MVTYSFHDLKCSYERRIVFGEFSKQFSENLREMFRNFREIAKISFNSIVVYIRCGPILSLVQFSFSIVLYLVMYDNEYKTNENKKIEPRLNPQHIHLIVHSRNFWKTEH